MIQFFSMLGDNLLFVFFSLLVSYELGLLYIWELFCFVLVEDRRNYLRCLHLFFSCLSLGRGVEREASVKVRCSLTVVFGFVCLATWWRGPFEQRVEDLCSVPQGGVKEKKSVEDRLSSVSGTSALCHEMA